MAWQVGPANGRGEEGRTTGQGGQRTHFQWNDFRKCWASVCVVVEEKALHDVLLNSDKTLKYRQPQRHCRKRELNKVLVLHFLE